MNKIVKTYAHRNRVFTHTKGISHLQGAYYNTSKSLIKMATGSVQRIKNKREVIVSYTSKNGVIL